MDCCKIVVKSYVNNDTQFAGGFGRPPATNVRLHPLHREGHLVAVCPACEDPPARHVLHG